MTNISFSNICRNTNTRLEFCVSFIIKAFPIFQHHLIFIQSISGDPDKRDQEEDEDVESEDYLANLKAQQQAKRPQQGQQQQFYRN